MAYKMNEAPHEQNTDAVDSSTTCTSTSTATNGGKVIRTTTVTAQTQTQRQRQTQPLQSTGKSVNLVTLACATVASTIAASVPIRSIAASAASQESCNCMLGTRMKNDGTLVTDADKAAQYIIVNALRNVSSGIRIVGEEDDVMAVTVHVVAAEEEEPVDYEVPPQSENINDEDQCNDSSSSSSSSSFGIDEELYGKVAEEMQRHMMFMHNGNMDEEHMHMHMHMHTLQCMQHRQNCQRNWKNVMVDPSRISVFVDPLDGTSQYAKGRYECVSTLVGITLDDVPIFGVICKPFGQAGYHIEDDCFTLYGGTLMNGAFVHGGEQIGDRMSMPTPRAVISSSRSGGIVKQCVDALHEEGSLGTKDPVLVSGAGEKSLRLLIGREGEALWHFPRPGTSLWDVAAADALLSAIGGKLTDRLGQRIDYSETRAGNDNVTGIVAASSVALHDACIRAYHLIEPPSSMP